MPHRCASCVARARDTLEGSREHVEKASKVSRARARVTLSKGHARTWKQASKLFG